MSIKVAIIGAGARGQAYAEYALIRPDEMQIVAVAEKKDYIRDMMKEKYSISDDMLFENYDSFFDKGLIADALFIATQDDDHVEPAIKAMEVGYKHLMIEKPIDGNVDKCLLLAEKAKEHGAIVQVCHSLRYTVFYRKLKEILMSGVIGDIVSVTHLEGLGHFHYSHSFVRGDWSNAEASSPMILAKCCHDNDLLLYLLGKDCKMVSSYGSLMHFKKENAPEGSAERCIECKYSHSCPYSATLYYDKQRDHFGKLAIEKEGFTDVSEGLRQGRYGRCAYKCDNNVVDHQVVNYLFDGGITANLTMTGFSDIGRETRIFGTMGEIYAHMEGNTIKVSEFSTGNTTVYDLQHDNTMHSGADTFLVREFMQVVRGEAEPISSIDVSVQSHVMCMAAEKSRVNNGLSIAI